MPDRREKNFLKTLRFFLIYGILNKIHIRGHKMKKRLSLTETFAVGSMLFGLFFGAGNLIFPVICRECGRDKSDDHDQAQKQGQ